jgi:peptidoglycan hydrolase-like protein with peptidoglycan-binding domain
MPAIDISVRLSLLDVVRILREGVFAVFGDTKGLEHVEVLGPVFRGERLLGRGASGEDVKAFQRSMAYYAAASGKLDTWTSADGAYGPRTAAAVQAFQRHAGMGADGVVGPATIRALSDAITRAQTYGLQDVAQLRGVLFGREHMFLGSGSGPAVAHLKQLLSFARWTAKIPGTMDPGAISGTFNGETHAAVEAWQRKIGTLSPNGVVGPVTLANLSEMIKAYRL